jgi:hypothetical protein
MSLTNVWLDTLADGLIRADVVVGVHAHRTPAITGKPSRWLLDVVVPASTGSGRQDSWVIGPAHRTLTQTDWEPSDAPQQLVRLLAQLDAANGEGIISITVVPDSGGSAPADAGRSTEPSSGTGGNGASGPGPRFRFTPFRAAEAGRHYDPEYL